MRILKGMMACLAAMFVLGYVNSCDSSAEDSITKLEQPVETRTIQR
jgi:hypothetical protein